MDEASAGLRPLPHYAVSRCASKRHSAGTAPLACHTIRSLAVDRHGGVSAPCRAGLCLDISSPAMEDGPLAASESPVPLIFKEEETAAMQSLLDTSS